MKLRSQLADILVMHPVWTKGGSFGVLVPGTRHGRQALGTDIEVHRSPAAWVDLTSVVCRSRSTLYDTRLSYFNVCAQFMHVGPLHAVHAQPIPGPFLLSNPKSACDKLTVSGCTTCDAGSKLN